MIIIKMKSSKYCAHAHSYEGTAIIVFKLQSSQ